MQYFLIRKNLIKTYVKFLFFKKIKPSKQVKVIKFGFFKNISVAFKWLLYHKNYGNSLFKKPRLPEISLDWCSNKFTYYAFAVIRNLLQNFSFVGNFSSRFFKMTTPFCLKAKSSFLFVFVNPAKLVFRTQLTRISWVLEPKEPSP